MDPISPKIHGEIPRNPARILRKVLKIVNDEFGEIIQEDNNDELTQSETNAQVSSDLPTNQPPKSTPVTITESNKAQEKLSNKETNNLADYLRIGMSINEARQAFQREIEMVELKHDIRESERQEQHGPLGYNNITTISDTSSNKGRGRGGLSFN